MPSLEHYPTEVSNALERTIVELSAIDPIPRALVVFGSVARGEYRANESDVNLAVVLEKADRAALDALHAPLRDAWRRARIDPFVFAERELIRLVDVFPIKLLDIKETGDCIFGSDPFAGFEVSLKDVRYRLEQELRNHVLRLRRLWVFFADDERAFRQSAYPLAASLRVELWALLRLVGRSPIDRTTSAVFREAAGVLEVPAGPLEALALFRSGDESVDLRSIVNDLLPILERAVDLVDGWEPAPEPPGLTGP